VGVGGIVVGTLVVGKSVGVHVGTYLNTLRGHK
jgi:hypothetical protein